MKAKMKDKNKKHSTERVDVPVKIVVDFKDPPKEFIKVIDLEQLMIKIAATKHCIRKDQERLQGLYDFLKKAMASSEDGIVKTEFYRAYMVKDGYKLVAQSDAINKDHSTQRFRKQLQLHKGLYLRYMRTEIDLPALVEAMSLDHAKNDKVNDYLEMHGLKIETRQKIRIKTI